MASTSKNDNTKTNWTLSKQYWKVYDYIEEQILIKKRKKFTRKKDRHPRPLEEEADRKRTESSN